MRSRIKSQDKNLLQKGFTLVELLVVIVILGILAAVVVFAVNGITNKSKTSACQIEVRTINTANQAYYAQNNAFPTGSTAAADITVLTAANLIQGTGASSNYTPLYSSVTGVYSATCP